MSDEKEPEGRNFFMGYDDLSDSSSDSDSHESSKKSRVEPEPSGSSNPQSRKRAAEPLPNPDDLFRSVSRPAFLYNPLNKLIDWDRRTVKAPEEVSVNPSSNSLHHFKRFIMYIYSVCVTIM